MQCKDIMDRPILEFLNTLDNWGTLFPGFDNSVSLAMPKETPEKLVMAKMNMMIRRGVVSGCTCGCRGDYEITENGLKELENKY